MSESKVSYVMSKYYVNKKAQDSGEHAVHKSDCRYLPIPANKEYLGEFADCHSTVRKAKEHYPKSNGCYYCVNKCHTTEYL